MITKKYINLTIFYLMSSVLCLVASSNLERVPSTFKNPILSGYHPDPSICRVGDDYYLVNSTFVWYPGIPIYHSKDLVNWKLIGHGIHRPDQIDLTGSKDREGIYAVTIRHHDGVFYLITTQVGAHGGNFYLTATDPAGPWSDPIWLREAPGIDPSLMWDDGKCYYTGHMWIPEQEWPTQCGIWTQELDLNEQKLVGERQLFSYGHANNASYTEGAHLYKINGKYMLMLSEGGTGLYHALSVHHSDSLWGPYVADMINPVLTHRHFGKKSLIQAIGHGDLVKTQNDEWWCVTLGKRVINGQTTLARETFLSRVDFEGQTPIFNGGLGKVLLEQERPNLPWTPYEKDSDRDQFDADKLALKWCFIRTPKKECVNVEDGHLKLLLQPEVVEDLVSPSLILQRIEHHKFSVKTKLSFKTEKENEEAGFVLYRTNENHYLLMKKKDSLVLTRSFRGIKVEVATIPYHFQEVFLHVEANGLDVTFSYGASSNSMKPLGDTQSLIVIADGNGNQFNGAGIGMYATSNGIETSADTAACFDWFEYVGQ